MITKKYRIADTVFAISSIYENVHTFCADYLTSEPAEIFIIITQADITLEREKAARQNALQNRPPQRFPDSYLEELAVYRKIAERMPNYDTLLFHGSVVAVDGLGYLFTAKSGTGKSTHTKLWMDCFGPRAMMVNDDKPLLHMEDTGVTVYGTPYNGKHRRGSNIAVPLKALCILTRAETNWIHPIQMNQAYATLLQQVYRPADPQAMRKTLSLLDQLAERVPLYLLGCNQAPDAAYVSYKGMQN